MPGLYKIFDEILVNAADNKQRNGGMDTMKVCPPLSSPQLVSPSWAMDSWAIPPPSPDECTSLRRAGGLLGDSPTLTLHSRIISGSGDDRKLKPYKTKTLSHLLNPKHPSPGP